MLIWDCLEHNKLKHQSIDFSPFEGTSVIHRFFTIFKLHFRSFKCGLVPRGFLVCLSRDMNR